MRLRYRVQALADIDAIHRFLEEHPANEFVMPGLVPGIHVLLLC